MNKKIIFITLAIVLALLIVFTIIVYTTSKKTPAEIAPTNNMTPTTATTTNVLPLKKATTPSKGNLNNNSATSDSIVMPEHFSWLRAVFVNNNEGSQQLNAYFKQVGLNNKIIVDICNVNKNATCLADLQKLVKSCNLSGDAITNVPLAYDNNTKQCYLGFDQISAYLNKEIEVNNEALRLKYGD